MRVKFNVDTTLVFQIGSPMGHSCAAYVHNAMYEMANINAVCLTQVVPKGGLPEFIEATRTLGCVGFDITTPHKSDIIQYLDECSKADKVFNCVNHVKWVEGKLVGIGLDGVGMGIAIEKSGFDLKGARVMMIGAGAVSGPIAANLCEKGAKKITVVNRTIAKAEHIAQTLNKLYGVETAVGPMTDQHMTALAPEVDLVVQCTPLGIAGEHEDFESLEFVKALPASSIVADVLYPRTNLLDAAKERGLKIVNGMGMMIYQSFAMMEFRFGVTLPEHAAAEAEEALSIAIAMRDIRMRRLGQI